MAGPKDFDDKVNENVEWAERQAEPSPVELVDAPTIPLSTEYVPPTFKNKIGRPTDYTPLYNDQAKKLSALGATDLDLADFFDVVESTLYLWKKEHPDFSESIKEGKALIDAQVEKSLLQRANGYTHIEERVFCHEGRIITHQTLKHYPPDTNAASLWLRNRKPKQWRDKRDIEFSEPFSLVMEEKDVNTL